MVFPWYVPFVYPLVIYMMNKHDEFPVKTWDLPVYQVFKLTRDDIPMLGTGDQPFIKASTPSQLWGRTCQTDQAELCSDDASSPSGHLGCTPRG